MAKTRAQRKAERRKRDAQTGRGDDSRRDDVSAQRATQVPESGDVAEVEAVLQTGASPEELGESVQPARDSGDVTTALKAPAPSRAEPAPSRADVGGSLEEAPAAPEAQAPVEAPAPSESRRERRRREREEQQAKEARRRARERKPAEVEERRRGAVMGFVVSCWAELKRVQWPDRDTLVQASAVTVLFVAVAAAYLGVLDAIFNWLVQRVL